MSLICGNSPLAFVICPMTPLASPVGDALASWLLSRGTTGGTPATQWLPNAHQVFAYIAVHDRCGTQVVDWLLDRIPN